MILDEELQRWDLHLHSSAPDHGGGKKVALET